MQRFSKIYFALVVLCLCGLQGARALSTQMCNTTDSMDFDANKISGTWYEVARNPAPTASLLCVETDFTLLSDDTMNINVTYCNTPSYPWINSTMSVNITLSATNTDGYNISYKRPGLVDTPPTLFKVMDTDYTNYVFICGYTNQTDNSTSFGILLTRDRMPATNTLLSYEEKGADSYPNFINGTMSLITQSATCYQNGAMPNLTIIPTIFLWCYAALKWLS